MKFLKIKIKIIFKFIDYNSYYIKNKFFKAYNNLVNSNKK
jgi:hypothetical protein